MLSSSFVLYSVVAVGSALGGIARLWCSLFLARQWGTEFPWGTFAVNVLGCTFIGAFAASTGSGGRWSSSVPVRAFVMTGFCGGFTTFSTFSLETLNLARDGQWGRAASNVIASCVCCLAGVWLGHMAASLWNPKSPLLP